MSGIKKKLAEFAAENRISGKGALCVMLVVTRRAVQLEPPLKIQDFITENKGQVAGLGVGAVQAILSDYGISQVLEAVRKVH